MVGWWSMGRYEAIVRGCLFVRIALAKSPSAAGMVISRAHPAVFSLLYCVIRFVFRGLLTYATSASLPSGPTGRRLDSFRKIIFVFLY